MMRSTAAQLLCFLSTINVVLARELASRNKTVLLGLTKTQLMIGVPVAIGVVGLIAFGIWHFFFKVAACNQDGKTINAAGCLCPGGDGSINRCAPNSFCYPNGTCNAVAACNQDGKTENKAACGCPGKDGSTTCDEDDKFCYPNGTCNAGPLTGGEGGDGDDTMDSGAGEDTMLGGAGNDTIDSGDDNDTVIAAAVENAEG